MCRSDPFRARVRSLPTSVSSCLAQSRANVDRSRGGRVPHAALLSMWRAQGSGYEAQHAHRLMKGMRPARTTKATPIKRIIRSTVVRRRQVLSFLPSSHPPAPLSRSLLACAAQVPHSGRRWTGAPHRRASRLTFLARLAPPRALCALRWPLLHAQLSRRSGASCAPPRRVTFLRLGVTVTSPTSSSSATAAAAPLMAAAADTVRGSLPSLTQ